MDHNLSTSTTLDTLLGKETNSQLNQNVADDIGQDFYDFESLRTSDEPEEEYGDKVFFKMGYLENAISFTVLEDAVKTFRVLAQCNNSIRVTKAMTDMHLHLRNKYHVAPSHLQDDLQLVDVKRLNCLDYKLAKLEKDRKFISEIIMETYRNLAISRSFQSLYNLVNHIDKASGHMALISEIEAKNKTINKELGKQLRQQRNTNKRLLYDTEFTISQLRRNLEDLEMKSIINRRFVENWQIARTEQHVETIKIKEKTAITNIEKYKLRTEYESRVHHEVEMLVNIIIQDRIVEIDDWVNKYDADIEAMDLKIQLKRNDHLRMVQERMELQAKFSLREKQIKNWLDFKKERELVNKYHNDMHRSACIVQAWWRGLLVRMKLGPFRQTKGRTAGKKKK